MLRLEGLTGPNFFILIAVVWVIGIIVYILLGRNDTKSGNRCNVRREVIQFKNINRDINEVVKKRG